MTTRFLSVFAMLKPMMFYFMFYNRTIGNRNKLMVKIDEVLI